MGFSGMSPGSLILIFCIALLIFGPSRLESFGATLGKAMRQFKENYEGEGESSQD